MGKAIEIERSDTMDGPGRFKNVAEDALFEFLSDQYPMGLRRLGDGSFAAILPLMFTTSIILGVQRLGYGNRFCFSTPERAREAFDSLESEDDVPDGFVARR